MSYLSIFLHYVFYTQYLLRICLSTFVVVLLAILLFLFLSYQFSSSPIENSAFAGCTGLTSIKIPNKPRSIADSAFAGCINLTNINIPSSVQTIGWQAFAGCSSLATITLPNSVRIRIATAGVIIALLGCGALVAGGRHRTKQVLRDEIFPANVIYNLGVAISEKSKIDNFFSTSQHFTFGAKRHHTPSAKEIYVLVIGEASRAASWQLYGYHRETNPRLSKRNDITIFSDIVTQSNATHKSVPMILSSVHTSQHGELYRRKGLPALFNEAGFTTYFLSCQSPQGAMIDHLASDAHHIIYMDAPRLDMQLVNTMRLALAKDNSPKLLFILHCYGSHFSYHQRYPQEFAHFSPDDDVAIHRKNREMIRNAYDNSILYTDHVIAELIAPTVNNAFKAILIFNPSVL